MGTPKLLNSVNFPLNQPIFFGNPGPYAHGTDLYWVIQELITDSSSPSTIVAYKSTDNGNTFTRIPPGTPANFVTVANGFDMAVSYPGSGTLIYVGYQGQETNANKGELKVVTFDMATDSFGSINHTGFTVGAGNPPVLDGFVFKLASSTVFVWDGGPGGLGVWASVFNGSSWSSAVHVNGATSVSGGALDAAVVDGAGNIGIYWQSGNIIHYSILSGTSVSTVTAIADITAFPKFGFTSFPFSIIYDAASDSVVWVFYGTPVAFTTTISLLIATPSAAPVFSRVVVATDTSNILAWDQIGIAKDGSTFSIVVNPTSTDTSSTGQLQLFTAAALTGPWSAATTYYDASVNPISTPPNIYEFVPIYVTDVAGSLFVTMGNRYPVPASPQFCGVLAVLGPSPTTNVVLEFDLKLGIQIKTGTGSFNPPSPPNPPPFCIINPTPTDTATLVLYDEPLEKQGS